MKKKVWILNHYAVTAYFENGGRHIWFGEELVKKGYDVTIFCANIDHNNPRRVDLGKNLFIRKKTNGIKFVFVKTSDYNGNNIKRAKNMMDFYVNVKRAMQVLGKKEEQPDVIIASSVHPFTCLAGLEYSKKIKVPCIVEIRDLWPLSLVNPGELNNNGRIAQTLYRLEKTIYEKASAVVFTMEGGKDYIKDMKWDKESGGKIDLSKIFHINNGVLLNQFDENKIKYSFEDKDLDDDSKVNLVYAGSVRYTNEVDRLVTMMKHLDDMKNVQLLIYGNGNYVDTLKDRIKNEKISNVKYKGVVEKKYIPSIISRSDINIVHWQNALALKYGCSYNKLFEYLAAGRPIFCTVITGYSIIKRYDCGVETKGMTEKEFADDIRKLICEDDEIKAKYGRNARDASKDYDFGKLTDKLLSIIESV